MLTNRASFWNKCPCISNKRKVNCTVVQALRLCTGRTAHRGSRGIALLFHYHGTRRGWGISVTPRPLFTPGKDPVPNVQETALAQWPLWIRSTDRPACSQSLYWLRYAAHSISNYTIAADSSNGVTNSRCCRYSCMRSWRWVEVPPETCRAVSRYK